MKLGRRLFARLARSRSGTAMTEFALALPFVLAAGLGGTEVVNYTVTKMKVNDIASHLARRRHLDPDEPQDFRK
jgi:Flp pilus assembly protein TadG